MTQTSETVTYSLESVLTRIESKIDNLQRDVNQKIDPATIAEKFPVLYRFSLNKWYIDNLYDRVFVQGCRRLARQIMEVDITHTDINKLELYARLGVPELWRFNGQIWRIYRLEKGVYQEGEFSPTFPLVPKTKL